jgi:hypothetical protein
MEISYVVDWGIPHKRMAGNLNDVACCSFFSNKNMAVGEGGMITTNDPRSGPAGPIAQLPRKQDADCVPLQNLAISPFSIPAESRGLP